MRHVSVVDPSTPFSLADAQSKKQLRLIPNTYDVSPAPRAEAD